MGDVVTLELGLVVFWCRDRDLSLCGDQTGVAAVR